MVRLRDSNSRYNQLFRICLKRSMRRVTPKSYPAPWRILFDGVGRPWTPGQSHLSATPMRTIDPTPDQSVGWRDDIFRLNKRTQATSWPRSDECASVQVNPGSASAGAMESGGFPMASV